MNQEIWLVVRGIGSISGAGVFRIAHGHYEIGRIGSSHIRVAHESVSRHHAMLVNDGGRVVVRDLGSRNGTFVDGQPVRSSTLRVGSSLRVGGVTFDIVAHPAKLASVGDSDETPAQFAHEPGEADHRAAQLPMAPHNVLRLLLLGNSEKQIAVELGITRHSVDGCVKLIYKRFGVHSRAALCARFRDNHTIERPRQQIEPAVRLHRA